MNEPITCLLTSYFVFLRISAFSINTENQFIGSKCLELFRRKGLKRKTFRRHGSMKPKVFQLIRKFKVNFLNTFSILHFLFLFPKRRNKNAIKFMMETNIYDFVFLYKQDFYYCGWKMQK